MKKYPLTNNTLHLIEYTLVIGGSFYLGMFIYPFSSNYPKEITAVSLREFGPQLELSSQKDLVLKTYNDEIVVKKSQIQNWIELYTRNYSARRDKRISYTQVSRYLEALAPDVNTEPINAKLKFENNRADVFITSEPGKKINIEASLGAIATAMIENRGSVSLSFDTVEPEVTLEKINNLGIRSLLGTGTSDYGKSPASRIHNLKLGMSKFNGIILKPGEQFSFNKLLGEVDDKSGYQAELVIKSGQLVKEFGGGLCQVSTTIFRAAILSGLPIIERKPHSFPVQYYNPQGFDSTIYPGVVDLKFVNDTPNHVLIQTKVRGGRLSVEIYGSDDGRKVVMEGPIQYDQQASGAMKAYFTRKIYRGEELAQEQRFDSVYKPPPPHPAERNPLE